MPGYSTDEKYSYGGTYRLTDAELDQHLKRDFPDYANRPDADRAQTIQTLRKHYDPKSDQYQFDPQRDLQMLDDHIRSAAQREGVDYTVLRSIIDRENLQESKPTEPWWKRVGYDDKGRATAFGVGQMKPDTFAQNRVRETDDIFDPYANIDASARFLKKLYKEFPDDPDKVIMAYRQGQGNINRGNITTNALSYLRDVKNKFAKFSPIAQSAEAAQEVPPEEEGLVPPEAQTGGFFPNLKKEWGVSWGEGPEVPTLAEPPQTGEFGLATEPEEMELGDAYGYLKPIARAAKAAETSLVTSSVDIPKRAHEALQMVRDGARATGNGALMFLADGIDEHLRPDVNVQSIDKLMREHYDDFDRAAKMLETGENVDKIADFLGNIIGGAPGGLVAFRAWMLTVPTNVKRRLEENEKARERGEDIPGAEKWYWIAIEEATIRAAAQIAFNLLHYMSPAGKIAGAGTIGVGQSLAGQYMQHRDPTKLSATEAGKEALALMLYQMSGGVRGKGAPAGFAEKVGREAFPRTQAPEFWARVAPGVAAKRIQAREKAAGDREFARVVPRDWPEEVFYEGGEGKTKEMYQADIVDAEGNKIRDVYITPEEQSALKGEGKKAPKDKTRAEEDASESILNRVGISDKYTGISSGAAPIRSNFNLEPGTSPDEVILVELDKDGRATGRNSVVKSADLRARLDENRENSVAAERSGGSLDPYLRAEKVLVEDAITAGAAQLRKIGIRPDRARAFDRTELGKQAEPVAKEPELGKEMTAEDLHIEKGIQKGTLLGVRSKKEGMEDKLLQVYEVVGTDKQGRPIVRNVNPATKGREISWETLKKTEYTFQVVDPQTGKTFMDAVTQREAKREEVRKANEAEEMKAAMGKEPISSPDESVERASKHPIWANFEARSKTSMVGDTGVTKARHVWNLLHAWAERVFPAGEKVSDPSAPSWKTVFSEVGLQRFMRDVWGTPEGGWTLHGETMNGYMDALKQIILTAKGMPEAIDPKTGKLISAEQAKPVISGLDDVDAIMRAVKRILPKDVHQAHPQLTLPEYLEVHRKLKQDVTEAEKATDLARNEPGGNYKKAQAEQQLKQQWAIWNVYASTGIRMEDLRTLKKENFVEKDLPSGKRIWVLDFTESKTGKKRGVGTGNRQEYPAWLTPEAKRSLDDLIEIRSAISGKEMEDGDYLFQNPKTGGLLSTDALTAHVKDANLRASDRDDVTSHGLRHGAKSEFNLTDLSDAETEYVMGWAASTQGRDYGTRELDSMYERAMSGTRLSKESPREAGRPAGRPVITGKEGGGEPPPLVVKKPPKEGEVPGEKQTVKPGKGKGKGKNVGSPPFGKGGEKAPSDTPPSAFRPTTDEETPGRTPTAEEPNTYFKEPTTPEEMRTSPLTSTHGGVLGKTEIVDWIRKKFEQVIRIGGQIRHAAGHYEPDSGAIRTQHAKDLTTTFHEVGHAIYRHVFPNAFDPRLGLVEAQELQPWRDVLTNPAMMRSGTFRGYKRREYVQESMAEYFARYFTRNRFANGSYAFLGDPTAQAGSFNRRLYEFHRWFDQKIHDNNPALWERMQQLTELFNSFSSQSAYDRAMSNISFGEREGEYKGNFKEVAHSRWTGFMRKMVDTEWRVRQLRAKYLGEGGSFQQTRDDPLYALDAARGAPGEALSWTGHTADSHDAVPRGIDYKPIEVALDPFNRYTTAKGPIKNLYQITGIVPQHLQNDWKLWMVTQTIKERERVAAVGTPNRRGRKWTHPLDPETIQAVDQRWANTPELEKFKEASKEFYRFREGMLEFLVQTGWLERSKLELFREMYPHYVPLQRAMYAKTGQPWEANVLRVKRAGGSLDVRSEAVKYTTHKGSDLDIIDPIESTMKDLFIYITGGRRTYANSTIMRMIKQMENWSQFIVPVQKDLKPVFVSQEGIVNLFRNSVTWHEAMTQHSETIREWIRQVRESVDSTETSTGAMPTDLSRGETLMKERITEALTARGWSPSESEQMVLRMIDAGRRRPEETASSTERITRITREVEKIVEKTTIMEKLKEAMINPPPEGKTIFYQKNGTPSGGTVITEWFKGTPRYYEVTDRDLFDVIKKPEMVADSEFRGFLGYVSGAAKALRIAATSHPTFWLRNPARDMVSAMVYNKYGTVMPWDVVGGIIASTGLLKQHRERISFWRSAGGERAGMMSLDRLGTQSMMEEYQRKTMAQFFKDQAMANPVNWLKIPLEMSRRISEKFETGTRLAVFETAVRHLERQGYSKEDAARMAMHQSRDTTLDYNRSGLYARQMNAFTAFYNAQVRDFEKIVREFGVEKTASGWKMSNPSAWLKALMFVSAPSIINAILNYDDPVYTNQKWYVKDFFWYFSPPGRRTAMLEYAAKYGKTPKEWDPKQWAEFNRDHPMWVFPKPFTLGIIFGSLPERMMAHAMREMDREGKGGADDVLKTAGKFFTSMASEEAMHGLLRSFGSSMPGDYGVPTPTGLVPILEGAVNRNFWAWRPIVPESKRDAPNIEQYAPHTSETSKKMARVFDVIIGTKLGGSRQAGKGFIETVLPLNSPAMFEHYLQGYFAQWGKDFLRAMDGAERLLIQDPYIRSVEQKEGKKWDSLTAVEKAKYADEFQRNMRGHWQLRIPPDPTKSDTWLIGSFIPRFPSANTQAMETMFENINANRALKQVYENRLVQREWTPWRTKYELEQLEKDAQMFRLGMADSETLSRMTSRVGQIMAIIDGLTTSPATDLTPAERRKYIDIMYMALNQIAVRHNQMVDDLFKAEQNKKKKEAAYP